MMRRFQKDIYKGLLLLLFVSSMYPWFLWNMSVIYIYAIGAATSLLFYFNYRDHFSFTLKKLSINAVLFIAIFWNASNGNFNAIISQFFLFLTISILINTKSSIKIELFNFITNGMSIIIGISFSMYILFLLNVPLPHIKLAASELGYSGINYFTFITDDNITNYYRFRSIFAEPGHLTMGLVLLIYANRFNIRKKSVLILFIAELFTLSLAGYIALLIGIVIFSLSSNSLSNRYARLIAIFIILFLVFVNTNLTEDNIINKAIISRLAYDKTTGTIVGNNRTKAYTERYYDNFIKSSDRLIGMESQKFNSTTYGSAGYKVYTIRYGIIGLILTIAFYVIYTISYLRYEIFGFLTILILLLFQNGYPFWFAVIFSFILGIANLSLRESKTQKRILV